jgi:hypothetical protein
MEKIKTSIIEVYRIAGSFALIYYSKEHWPSSLSILSLLIILAYLLCGFWKRVIEPFNEGLKEKSESTDEAEPSVSANEPQHGL